MVVNFLEWDCFWPHNVSILIVRVCEEIYDKKEDASHESALQLYVVSMQRFVVIDS